MTTRQDGKQNLIKDMSESKALDVELSSKALPSSPQLQERLKALGEELKPHGHRYAGSATVHYYVSELGREVSLVNQIHDLNSLSESVAAFGVADLALKIRQYFNPHFKQKTRNALDKR
jgi:hypothetical protein